ncbi:hypothetical protein SAMN05421823_115100 [Catalinimonas alkaloidigena]|uniref:Uncharacterized protein n=1 Tax=Catalinimonas alkaloidigena TaxID=1075417 RepID=A0A1G9U5U5_9BACT|nr:hypothetical protein [Catalinimonas alkaloidigena]SDM55336.1 hypothetical protein SAMN05421823_115100 [Catalinimonas alkaloidigena]
MDIVAGILLLAAATVGLFPLTSAHQHHEPPRRLVGVHLGLAVLGFLALVVYAISTDQPHKHGDTLTLLSIAALLGGVVWRTPRLPWIIAYALAGGFAVLWLLTYLIPTT